MRPRGNFIESNIAEAKEVVVLVQHMSTNLCLSQNNTGQVKFYDEIFQAPKNTQQRNSLRKQLEIFSEVKRAQESNYDDYHSNKKTDYLSESAAERESTISTSYENFVGPGRLRSTIKIQVQ